MIRDDIAVVRTIVQTAYNLGATDKTSEDRYKQGVFDLAGELLWPDQGWETQRERLARLFAAHRALFVDAPA